MTKRVVVITGGGTGMGRAAAQLFAKSGDTVYIIGRRKEKLEETAKGYENIFSLASDLTDINSVENLRNEILKKHKSVDVLVNNAGGIYPISEEDDLQTQAEGWHKIIATNLDSVFFMITAFSPHITKRSGRIINISSTAALAGSTSGNLSGQAYSAAKAGIHGLSMTLVHSLSPEGITVNTIAPGVVDVTEFFGGNGVPDSRKQTYLDRIPLKRLGKPEEIASAIFYLASADAAFINGEIFNVNGGMVFGR